VLFILAQCGIFYFALLPAVYELDARKGILEQSLSKLPSTINKDED
jgi:hypothetical protein